MRLVRFPSGPAASPDGGLCSGSADVESEAVAAMFANVYRLVCEQSTCIVHVAGCQGRRSSGCRSFLMNSVKAFLLHDDNGISRYTVVLSNDYDKEVCRCPAGLGRYRVACRRAVWKH